MLPYDFELRVPCAWQVLRDHLHDIFLRIFSFIAIFQKREVSVYAFDSRVPLSHIHAVRFLGFLEVIHLGLVGLVTNQPFN